MLSASATRLKSVDLNMHATMTHPALLSAVSASKHLAVQPLFRLAMGTDASRVPVCYFARCFPDESAQ
jgi:hypothetical protein